MTAPVAPKVANAARLARDPAFQDRALIAALREAISVLREPEDTANHVFRVAYAQSILRSPESYQATVSWVLAAAPQLAEASTADAVPDQVMAAVLHEMWNGLSQP